MILKGYSDSVCYNKSASADLHSVGVALYYKQVIQFQCSGRDFSITCFKFLHVLKAQRVTLNISNTQIFAPMVARVTAFV